MTADTSDSAPSPPANGTPTRSKDEWGLTPVAAPGDMAVTGILLVGGGSSRFGSPKALAEFRGEMLAVRAWRTLGEVCTERLAVGKPADELDLPFAVHDDGTEERAPLYGVLAGLRAATNDVCVVLPVDCPLVTSVALRALAEARAVPQTGPLPGAYERAHISELERRIERGELSLRGVNRNVFELEEELLANVNTPDDLRRIEGVSTRRAHEGPPQ